MSNGRVDGCVADEAEQMMKPVIARGHPSKPLCERTTIPILAQGSSPDHLAQPGLPQDGKDAPAQRDRLLEAWCPAKAAFPGAAPCNYNEKKINA